MRLERGRATGKYRKRHTILDKVIRYCVDFPLYGQIKGFYSSRTEDPEKKDTGKWKQAGSPPIIGILINRAQSVNHDVSFKREAQFIYAHIAHTHTYLDRHIHLSALIDAHCVLYVSPSTRSAPLGHKELLAPILLQSYQRHLSVHRASFHLRLRPSIYIRPCRISTRHNSKHIAETYRLLLCVFVDSSRVKLVFIAIRAPLLPWYVAGMERQGKGGKEVRRRTTKNHLDSAFRKSGERRNPAAPCFYGHTIYLLAPPMCDMTYITRRTHCCWNEFAIWGCTCINSIDITFFHRIIPRHRTLWINSALVDCL